jgi:hypothetical protein
MTTAELTYGEAAEVAEYLLTGTKVTQDDLHSALCNAMERIARLEKRIANLEKDLNE